MALPKITNNSPMPGSISWTDTALVYAGTSYTISAGSSSNKFVWWEYNNGAPILRDGSSLPPLAAEDVLLFLNKDGIGAVVPLTDVVDGSLLVSGSILAGAIGADEIKAIHMSTDSVTAKAIKAGAVTAEAIDAGVITADKLAVGSIGDNLVTNGSFEEFTAGVPIGWVRQTGVNGGSSDVVSGVSSSGAYALRLIATATNSDVRIRQDTAKQVPVSAVAGRKWYVAARIGAGTATTKGFYLRINWFTAAGAVASTPTTDIVSNVAVATSWTVVEGQATPPANAAYMRIEVLLVTPSVATNVYVDEVVAREVVMSALIGDSQITTPKLVTNAVTADKITAGSISASKLMLGDLTNLAADGNFTETAKTNWTGSGTIVTSTTEPNKLRVVTAASGSNDQTNRNRFSVTPGEKIYGAVWVYGEPTNVGNGAPNMHLSVALNNGTSSWPSFASLSRAAVSGAWTLLDGIITIPADARTAVVEPAIGYSADAVGNVYYFRQVVVRRMNGGELIVDGAISAEKIAVGAIKANSAIIVDGAIGTAKIGEAQITEAKIKDLAVTDAKISTLNAGKITAGFLDAARIEAGSIFADKLVIGAGGNLFPDPEVKDTGGWSMDIQPAPTGSNGGGSILIPASTAQIGAYYGYLDRKRYIPVTGGGSYTFSVKFRANIVIPSGYFFTLYARFYKPDGGIASVSGTSVNSDGTAANTWGTCTLTMTVPDDAAYIVVGPFAQASLNTLVRVSDFSVRQMSDATLITNEAVQTRHMKVGTIDAGILSAGSITAPLIGSKQITADKLIIASSDNMIIEPDFTNGGSSWQSKTYVSVNSTAGRGGGPAMRWTGSTTNISLLNLHNKVAIEPDSFLYGSMMVKSTVALPAGSVDLVLRAYTTATTYTDSNIAANAILVANTWTSVSGTVRVPSGAIAVEFYIQVQNSTTAAITDIDMVTVTRAAGGELIVDGAIDGRVITGATFQTTAAVNRGISLTSTYLRAWNSTGSQTFDLNASTGSLTVTGGTITGSVVRTSSSGDRVELNGDMLTAYGRVGSTLVNVKLGPSAVTTYSGTTKVVGIGFDNGDANSGGLYSSGDGSATLASGGNAAEARTSLTLRTGVSTPSLWTASGQIQIEAMNAISLYSNNGGVFIDGPQVLVNNKPVASTTPDAMGASQNLNNYTNPGLFSQSQNANATTALQYPIELAGMLEVMSNGSNMVYQRYTSYNSGRTFTRSKYGTTWYPWGELASEGAWSNLGLQFGWSNYTGGGNYYAGVHSRLLGDSVQITGMVKGGALNSNIVQLPVTHRPSNSHFIPGVAAATFGAVQFDQTTGFLRYVVGPTAPGYLQFTGTLPLS